MGLHILLTFLRIYIVTVAVITCGFEFLDEFIQLTYTAVKLPYSNQNKGFWPIMVAQDTEYELHEISYHGQAMFLGSKPGYLACILTS